LAPLNPEPNHRFSLVNMLNLDLNPGPVQCGSGSNYGSKLNCGNPTHTTISAWSLGPTAQTGSWFRVIQSITDIAQSKG